MTKAKSSAYKLITGVKGINKEIADLAHLGNEHKTRMHVLALSVLKHVAQHRNTTVLVHFLDNVPEHVRVNSLKQWFETFGNLTYSSDKDTKGWRLDDDKKVRLGDAQDKPFWKFKANEGLPYQPLNMETFLKATISKLEKDAKEAGVDHSALINALRGHTAQALNVLPN